MARDAEEWSDATARGFRYRPELVPDDFLATEVFGFPPASDTEQAVAAREACACPFSGGHCTKLASPAGTGICSMRYRAAGFHDTLTWAVCPNRLSGQPFQAVLAHHFGERAEAAALVTEVQIPVPKMSFDAVGLLLVTGEDAEFIGIEAQTIDTRGGSLRIAWKAYVDGEPQHWRARYAHARPKPKALPGVNSANVWKRLLPQVMNKGRMYAEWDSTLYVLVQSNVLEFLRGRMPSLRELSRQERVRAEIVWMPWDYTGDVDPDTGMLRTEIGSPVYSTVDQVEQAFVEVAAAQRPAFLASVIAKLERNERKRMRGVAAKARRDAPKLPRLPGE